VARPAHLQHLHQPRPSQGEEALVLNTKTFQAICQCCGSMTFWCGSGSASMTLIHGHQKTNFFKKHFCSLLSEGTLTSFLKDKKSKRSHKTVGIKVFLTIFA
jgi:hypothetical protein